MPVRVAIGGLFHETNTFVSQPTRLEDFRSEWTEGESLLERHASTGTELGGIIDGARERGWTLAPLLFAMATPSGTVTREAYTSVADRLTDLLRTAGSAKGLDAVILVLHGAMVAQGFDDPEGDLLGRVRALVGPRVPFVCTTDFHANVTETMVAAADCLIAYDTYPHLDARERGLDACRVVERLLAGEKAAAFLARPALVPVPQVQASDRPLIRTLVDLAHEFEADPRVINASVCCGFPYSDVPFAGMSFTVTTAADPELARATAAAMASLAWSRRDELRASALPVPAAVARARELSAGPGRGPVILIDSADNIGGGTPGDGTAVLAELLVQRAEGALVVIRDPEAAAACWRAGRGAAVDLVVGGKTDCLHGDPVPLTGRVLTLSDGQFAHRGPYMRGRHADMGRTAVILVDTDGADVTVVLTQNRQPPWDAEMLFSLGIDPRDLRLLAVKAAVAWRAAFGDMARAEVEVDAPGAASLNLGRLPFQKLRRPIFPLDDL